VTGTPLHCHCGRVVALWQQPVGGDGGAVAVPCKRCGSACATCHGWPRFPLRGPIRILPEASIGALWRVLTGGRAG
jgi:hypothetical protein